MAITRKGAGPNALTDTHWRFEPVKHLYTKYLPPKQLLPPSLSALVLEAYNSAVESQPVNGVTHRPHPAASSVTPTTESRPRSPGIPPLAASLPAKPTSALPIPRSNSSTSLNVDPTRSQTEEELRSQLARLQKKLQGLRDQIDASAMPQSSQFKSRVLAEAEDELERERSKRKKMEESVADLKQDVLEKDRKYKDLRRRRREVEDSLADARSSREARAQEAQDPQKLDELVKMRDDLSKLVASRKEEAAASAQKRISLQQEVTELRRQLGLPDPKPAEMPSVGVMLPALIQAFKDLQE